MGGRGEAEHGGDALDGGARGGRAEGAEGLGQGGDVGEAPGGVFFEAARDDGLERRRELGSAPAQGPDGALQNGDVQFGQRFGGEGALAGEQLVQHDAERPEVGTGVDAAGVAQLLGRHVAGRAHQS